MIIGVTERGDAGLDKSWRNFDANRKILITKRPDLLLEEKLGHEFIIHCTITGLGGTAIEPNVPHPTAMLEAYQTLFDRYGGENVVLRVDPIIPGPKDSHNFFYKYHLPVIEKLGNDGRLRISFLDAYNHVRQRMPKADIPWKTGLHSPLEWRQELLRKIEQSFIYRDVPLPDIEICGEPNMECSGCVSVRDFAAMGLDLPTSAKKSKQRKACMCLSHKTEMLKHKEQCPNGCLYCYWH